MGTIRKKYTSEEKARIALESLKGEMTIAQITSKYGAHATQIANWRKQLKTGMASLFSQVKTEKEPEKTALIEELYTQIGRLQMELSWLKKKSSLFD